VDVVGKRAWTAVMLSTGITRRPLSSVVTVSRALSLKPVLKLAMVELSVLITACMDCEQLSWSSPARLDSHAEDAIVAVLLTSSWAAGGGEGGGAKGGGDGGGEVGGGGASGG